MLILSEYLPRNSSAKVNKVLACTSRLAEYSGSVFLNRIAADAKAAAVSPARSEPGLLSLISGAGRYDGPPLSGGPQ